MKIATKTPRHQVKKNKIPLCLCAFVAIIFIRLRATARRHERLAV